MSDEEILELARELNLIHYYDSEGHWSGVTDDDMLFQEENKNDERLLEILKPFAEAVLKKASEK